MCALMCKSYLGSMISFKNFKGKAWSRTNLINVFPSITTLKNVFDFLSFLLDTWDLGFDISNCIVFEINIYFSFSFSCCNQRRNCSCVPIANCLTKKIAIWPYNSRKCKSSTKRFIQRNLSMCVCVFIIESDVFTDLHISMYLPFPSSQM